MARRRNQSPSPQDAGSRERRPLSTFAKPGPTVEAHFKPALEVDEFRWSASCEDLVYRHRDRLRPALLALLAADEAGRSLIGIGAPAAGVGCTTMLACLARLLVDAGKSVAIVDGNFTAPGLAAQLGPGGRVGWEDVLAGDAPLAESVVYSLADRIALLPLVAGGDRGGGKLRRIHASVTAGVLRYHYDMVLFDLGVHRRRCAGVDRRRLARQCRLDGIVLTSGLGRRPPCIRSDSCRPRPSWRRSAWASSKTNSAPPNVSQRVAMYLDYWQLDAKPFEPGCDARSTFKGTAHQAALHKLRYAIENRRAAGLVAGPAGTGKTLLIETLRQQLGERYQPFVRVVFPQMTDRDLLVYLAEQFGAPPADPPRHTIEESLRRLEYMLAENVRRERHAVIVIDEAHLLEDSGLLEPLRLLLNLGSLDKPPFTLLLVGQPTLLPMVQRHGGLDERIDIKVLLSAAVGRGDGRVRHAPADAPPGRRGRSSRPRRWRPSTSSPAAFRGGSIGCATWPCWSASPTGSTRSTATPCGPSTTSW